MSRIVLLSVLGLVVSLSGCDAFKDAAVKKVEEGKQQMDEASAQEAEMNLRAIGSGAQVYYQSDHAGKDGLTATTMVFPKATSFVCSAGGDVGAKVSASDTNWHSEPWKSLAFSVTAPHSFMYCYESSRDQKSFAAWAEAGDRAYCLTGKANGAMPSISPIRDLGAEGECTLP